MTHNNNPSLAFKVPTISIKGNLSRTLTLLSDSIKFTLEREIARVLWRFQGFSQDLIRFWFWCFSESFNKSRWADAAESHLRSLLEWKIASNPIPMKLIGGKFKSLSSSRSTFVPFLFALGDQQKIQMTTSLRVRKSSSHFLHKSRKSWAK